MLKLKARMAADVGMNNVSFVGFPFECGRCDPELLLCILPYDRKEIGMTKKRNHGQAAPI
jgi:hypothetical protein